MQRVCAASASQSFNGAARRCARKAAVVSRLTPSDAGFNGAARRCARKGPKQQENHPSLQSFNGAARRCARKESVCHPPRLSRTRLQWGRAQMRAEGVSAFVAHCVMQAASMGPRADARGRKLTNNQQKNETQHASMGPRADARGRLTILAGDRTLSSLQWGRAQMRAEGNRGCLETGERGRASMGPRADARGR